MYKLTSGGPPSVRTAAAVFQEICYQNKDNISAAVIVAGWDKHNGGTVYNVPLGGSLHKQHFAIGGSGSTYIYGFCDSQYKENMSREECVKFVQNGLALAMARDGSSGGVIRLAVIDEKGVERILLSGDKLPAFWSD
jgi:20S proteasome subunit beta 1